MNNKMKEGNQFESEQYHMLKDKIICESNRTEKEVSSKVNYINSSCETNPKERKGRKSDIQICVNNINSNVQLWSYNAF